MGLFKRIKKKLNEEAEEVTNFVKNKVPHDYSKARDKFIKEGECESSLRYILGKSLSNKEENKAIDRIKNSDTKVGEILNRHSQQFNADECVYAMKKGLAHEGYSNTKIEDIIIQIAGKVPESGDL